MLATFMEVLDTSIASVALPHIAGNLGASTDEATWVLTSYLVSNAIMLPTSAWFGEFLWPEEVFDRVHHYLHCVVVCVRGGDEPRDADRRARGAGRGRRRVATAGASDPAGEFSAGPPRRGHGGVWRGRDCRADHRPDAGRLADGQLFVALGFYINLPVGVLACS